MPSEVSLDDYRHLLKKTCFYPLKVHYSEHTF